jgi:hypothetical protein
MDTSNIPVSQLLIKYIHGDITKEELVLLNTYIKEFPELKEKLEELSDPDNVWDRFWYQHEIDTDKAWNEFKNKHLAEYASDNSISLKKEHADGHTSDAATQMSWPRTMLTAAVIVLIFGAVTYSFTNIIIDSNRPERAEMQSEQASFVTGPVALVADSGYWDLPDKGQLKLEGLTQDRIELSGSSILNQGEMFTIVNNDVDGEMQRAIRLVTADKPIKLQLVDGSQVTINKNSSFLFPVPFDSGQRIVGLWGEAYFEVEGNQSVPFIVQLNNKVTIKAYGTNFNVKYDGKDSYTTLMNGHVSVTMDGQTTSLLPREQVKITETGQVTKVALTHPEDVVVWFKKRGFEYRNIGFRQMMMEIGKWFGVGVEFNGVMPNKNIDNIMLNEDVELQSLIEDIEKAYDVKIDVKDKKIIVNK